MPPLLYRRDRLARNLAKGAVRSEILRFAALRMTWRAFSLVLKLSGTFDVDRHFTLAFSGEREGHKGVPRPGAWFATAARRDGHVLLAAGLVSARTGVSARRQLRLPEDLPG